MAEKQTIDSAFRKARHKLEEASIETADLDAALLLEHASGATTLTRMTHPHTFLSDDDAQKLDSYIIRRIAREPAHRIIGSREFYGLSLLLNEATLVPRPDTEILIDTVLPFVHARIAQTGSCHILDLGTGTGAIALALLNEANKATAVGTDMAQLALEAATQNATRHKLGSRFETVQSNWFDNISGQFDLIISNPPYIASSVIEELPADVRDHDPRLALDGGTDGLNAYAIIASRSAPYLKKGGRIAVEIGFDQKSAVLNLFEVAGYSLNQAKNDLNGLNRVLFFA